ncbi:MAG: hypothetical protein J6333_03140, partial [Planctomycetes bacterium]|nr:hypothetical protein [Planctomycetota bacterium]
MRFTLFRFVSHALTYNTEKREINRKIKNLFHFVPFYFVLLLSNSCNDEVKRPLPGFSPKRSVCLGNFPRRAAPARPTKNRPPGWG